MYKELSCFIKILCKAFESDQREVNRGKIYINFGNNNLDIPDKT